MATKRRVCWKEGSELEEVKVFSDDDGPLAKKPHLESTNGSVDSSNNANTLFSSSSEGPPKEPLKPLHKTSSDESLDCPPGDEDLHPRSTSKVPESIIKRRLCPHRQYGCLFETTAEDSSSLEEHLHSETGCLFEKLKGVIQNKENQVLDLKQQLKQVKMDMMIKIHNLEQQLFLLSSNTMQLATKFQMQENQRQSLRTESKPLPIDPKYTRNPFKLNAQLVCTLEGHKQIVTALVTNDFTMFTGSGDATQQGSLKKWNLTSFAIQDSTDDGVVFSLIIHESKLICGSMNHIKIRDLETLEVYSRLEGHRGEVKALVVAGTRLLSGAVDGFVKVWDLDTYQCLLSLKAHDSQVIGIEASVLDQELQYLFTASHDSTIKMWSPTFQLVHTFKGHVGPIKSLVRIDEFLISGAEDNLIKIWDWSKKDEIESMTGLPGVTALKSGKLNGIDIFFSGHVNGSILIWDFKSRELLQYIDAHKDRVRAITGFQQLLITASYDKTIKVWQ